MSLRAFGARLCSRAGAGSAALALAPPRLREHLSGVAVGRLPQLEPLLRTVELREAAKGMEKVLGIGADIMELLHQHDEGLGWWEYQDPLEQRLEEQERHARRSLHPCSTESGW